MPTDSNSRLYHPEALFWQVNREALMVLSGPRALLLELAHQLVAAGVANHSDFCYKEAFFEGGRSFYTQTVDAALAEIDRLPGRHLYFLDDHLLGNPRFAAALFDGMRGMGRLWQGAGPGK